MENKVQEHKHDGVGTQKLYAGDSLEFAPLESLTPKESPSTLTSGGLYDLKTDDAVILQNVVDRFNELEQKLQLLGLLK